RGTPIATISCAAFPVRAFTPLRSTRNASFLPPTSSILTELSASASDRGGRLNWPRQRFTFPARFPADPGSLITVTSACPSASFTENAAVIIGPGGFSCQLAGTFQFGASASAGSFFVFVLGGRWTAAKRADSNPSDFKNLTKAGFCAATSSSSPGHFPNPTNPPPSPIAPHLPFL